MWTRSKKKKVGGQKNEKKSKDTKKWKGEGLSKNENCKGEFFPPSIGETLVDSQM